MKISACDLRKKHSKSNQIYRKKKAFTFFMLGWSYLFWQVGYSAPTQAAIREDLNLSLAEVSVIYFSIHILIYIVFSLLIYFFLGFVVFNVWFFSDHWCNAWGYDQWPDFRFRWPERGMWNLNAWKTKSMFRTMYCATY